MIQRIPARLFVLFAVLALTPATVAEAQVGQNMGCAQSEHGDRSRACSAPPYECSDGGLSHCRTSVYGHARGQRAGRRLFG